MHFTRSLVQAHASNTLACLVIVLSSSFHSPPEPTTRLQSWETVPAAMPAFTLSHTGLGLACTRCPGFALLHLFSATHTGTLAHVDCCWDTGHLGSWTWTHSNNRCCSDLPRWLPSWSSRRALVLCMQPWPCRVAACGVSGLGCGSASRPWVHGTGVDTTARLV